MSRGVIDMNSLSDDEQLLVEIVSVPSVTGLERHASELFVRHASRRGFDAEVDQVNNALAHRGASAGDAIVHIVLLGHIDTVPGEIPVQIADGMLYGRGSVDAKGPLCAMLGAATRAVLPEGVRLTVAGAVGEEGESPGARHLCTIWQPDACVIGEPSGWDGVTLGYKGRLLTTAEASCPNHHSAGRDPSASDMAIAWWSAVLEHVASYNAGRVRAFDIIQATVQGMRYGCDGLTQRGALEAGFRLPVEVPPDEFARTLDALGAGRVQVVSEGEEWAYETGRNDPVVRAISHAIRGQGGRPRPKLKTGTADFNVVGPAWNCPIAAYGPGDSTLDHTPFERQSLEEYGRSIDVLAGAIGMLAQELVAART